MSNMSARGGKKTALIFTIILLPLDFLMLIFASLTAYSLRVGSFVTEIRPVIYTLQFSEYLFYSILVSLIWLFIFAFAGLYKIERRKFNDEFVKIILACSTGILAIIVAIFLKRELFSSRFIILAAWGLSILYVTLGRLIISQIQKSLLKKGIGARKIVIIGNDKNTKIIGEEIKNHAKLGYQIIKTFPSYNETIKTELLKLISQGQLDEIVQADPNLDRQATSDLIDFTEAHHITFKFTADIYRTKTSRLEIDTLAGLPIFEIAKTKLEGWGRIYKRIFDIITALILIIIFSPILIITAIAVKLNSRGPIIYKNIRVGQDGKEFNLFKFRSMYYEFSTGVGNPEQQQKALAMEKELIAKQNVREGALYKIKNDPRITKVGKFTRKWSIDELPQFFNVLFGQISLVGPRPHQPREVAKYTQSQLRTLDIKPGVTGLAQISGRSDLDFDEEAKLDIYYIENWSLWLDIIILLRTPKVVLSPKREAL
ncbi:MAG: sugar transferase [Candidatus Parcubacteria bacterium]|nr:sugar transferase [Candidatus Parcubacteria bacterium]